MIHTGHANLKVGGCSRRLLLLGRLSKPRLESEYYSNPASSQLGNVAQDGETLPADHPVQHA
jgi:hypothetical protein